MRQAKERQRYNVTSSLIGWAERIHKMIPADGKATLVEINPWYILQQKITSTHQGSKFHSSDRLRRVKMIVGQVEYLQDLSDRRLRISDFHISCIGFIYFRQVNCTFGQVTFTIHLPDGGQVHSIWNFEACQCWPSSMMPLVRDQLVKNTSWESIFTIISYLEKWSKDHNSSGKLKLLTICGPLMPYGNIDLDQHWITDNSLVPDGTKPSPGQMLTYVAFTWEQFQKCSWTWSTTCVQRLQF